LEKPAESDVYNLRYFYGITQRRKAQHVWDSKKRSVIASRPNTTSDIRIGIPFTYSLTNQWIWALLYRQMFPQLSY